MSIYSGPEIVENGLIFAFDMDNTQKSWKGRPVTNHFILPTEDINGFEFQNGIFTRVRTGNYGGYEIQPNDYVWRFDITGLNDCPYHGCDVPTTAGDVVTFSFDFYIDPSTTNYPISTYLANMENAGSGFGSSVVDTTPGTIGVWKRKYFSGTATGTGNARCLLYPGACSTTRLADSGFILYKNPQVELNAPGSIPSPFVAGTRSNTESILDWTGNNTATINSLTYNSDNTFEFNALQDDNMTLASPPSLTNEISIEVWVKLDPTINNITGWICGREGSYRLLYTSNAFLWICATDNNAWYSAGTYISASATPHTQTYQVVVTYDGSNNKIYLNGKLMTTGSAISGNIRNVSSYYIMRDGSTDPSIDWGDGIIYSHKIYNKALTANEVQQNFNALRGKFGI